MMNKYIGSFFEDPLFSDLSYYLETPEGKHNYGLNMRTDIKEVGNNYVLNVELPGVKKEEININLENGYLTISYEYKKEVNGDNDDNEDVRDDKEEKYLRRERYFGSMKRSFYVDENLKPEDINASYTDGILTITLPKEKTEEEKIPSRIEIK